MTPARTSTVPRHSTKPVQSATTMATAGERGVYRCLAYVVKPRLFELLPTESFHDPDGFETLLHHGDDVALMEPDLMGGALDHAVEPGDKQQQERRYGYGDKRKIKFQPEHDAEHADDRQQIDQNVESRR